MYIKVSAKNREKESSHLLKGCEQSNEPVKFIRGIYSAAISALLAKSKNSVSSNFELEVAGKSIYFLF
jgi:hypothetical protein